MAEKEVVGVESMEEEGGGGGAKLRRWVVRCAMWEMEKRRKEEGRKGWVLFCYKEMVVVWYG